MGLGTIDMPHLAIGGMPDLPSADLSKTVQPAKSNATAGGMDMAHFGTVDLQSDKGNFRVIAHEDVAKLLGQNAIESQTFSTGKKPGWYGGRG